MLRQLQQALRKQANKERARISMSFFKTGPGEYGEGDQFIGVKVPEQRKIAKQYRDLSLDDINTLLQSPIHEERLVALIILVEQFKRADADRRKIIFDFYVQHTDRINNWDLVDSSAHYIVGAWLFGKPDRMRFTLAHSRLLWERRIAIISTFYDIYQGQYQKTFEIASILLKDEHDLIQKAVGWMLREVGKRCSEDILKAFLDEHYQDMPRTMLRYAVERLGERDKKRYMTRANTRISY